MTIAHRNPGNAGSHWARVAGRRMRLADGAEIIRQEHRGVLWYVVHDRIGDRFYRFSPAAYLFLNLLDGRRTVEEAYQLIVDRLGADAPTELDVIKLFWRLHAADLLMVDGVQATTDLVLRADALDRQRFFAQLRSPLAIRLPLLDPSRLLDLLRPLARLVYSVPGFLIWLGLIIYALGLVAVHWQELSTDFSDRILAFDNLIIIWMIFPVVKLFHELGHGLALRRWDCHSHEMGIMFLVFMPVPYVDASSSATMVRPLQRAIVGAGGLYVELSIAALATIVWTHAEPGLVRAICFNIMTVAGVSALLFNGNPLLRFDAYYILSDLIEVPNLGQRSAQLWQAGIQKYLLGVKEVEFPIEAEGERPWLIAYAPLSICYRMVLMFGIAIFVAKKFFFLGTLLAVLAVFNVVLWPLLKGLNFLLRGPKLKRRRASAILRTGAALGLLALFLFAIPIPNRTLGEGVVWYDEGAELRPLAGGMIRAIHHGSGDLVQRGDPILDLEDPETEAEIVGLTARIKALKAQERREIVLDRDKARLTAEEISYVGERLATARERLANLSFVSPASGRLVIPRQDDLAGGWVGRGMRIGHVSGQEGMVVLVALRQNDIELVNRALDGVSIRFASDIARVHRGRIDRHLPEATDRLPDAVLSVEGGGPFSLRQTAPQETGLRSIEMLFVLQVAVADGARPIFGERAYVMFDHGYEVPAVQMARWLRQLFLREFEV